MQHGLRGMLIFLYVAPYTITFLLEFFSSLSISYEEAAALNGATPAQTFWKIMFPLIQKIIASVTGGGVKGESYATYLMLEFSTEFQRESLHIKERTRAALCRCVLLDTN